MQRTESIKKQQQTKASRTVRKNKLEQKQKSTTAKPHTQTNTNQN